MSYKSFDLLEKLYFIRTGGSSEELKAANILKEECEKLGVDATIESFQVDGCNIKKAELKFTDVDLEIECAGVGMSSSTPLEGLTAEFTYITSQADAEIQDVAGKICLVHSKLIGQKLYKTLFEKKAIGLILCTGNVYDENDLIDLDPYMYRERHYNVGKIPAVCIRMKDAEKVLRSGAKMVHMTMIEDELKNDSHNVVATIEGSSKKDEIVVFTAHYDSVSYSKGAYDNATGSTGIMQLLAYFKDKKPSRTLKFVWCGSEEMGLLGSKAYIETHKEDIKKYKLCINIDMIGVTIGYDIACCTANNSLVNYVKYFGAIEGFPILVRQGVYSSDSTPFADAGVPGMSFARIAPQGGAVIHSRKDVIDYLEPTNYYRSCEFIYKFANSLVEAKNFPVEQEIPQNMKEEIEYYFGRKERQ